MKCPFCSSENTRVIDSRPADDNNSIRRRRLCDDCGKRFTTYEKVETIPLVVIKKDNIREQYDRSKIEAGVLRACHKRPVSIDQISKLIDEVEVEIFNIVNFDFSEEFNAAVEAKQTAQQQALKAEQDLVRIEVEAKQKIAQAEAEAESIRLIQEALAKSPDYVDYVKWSKWDGKLPEVVGSDGVLVDVGDLG